MRLDGRWESPKLGDDPVTALVLEHAELGVRPDGWTASASWEREVDIPDEVYFRANESI